MTADRVERLEQAVAEQGGRCLWCGTTFGRLVPATTDHLVPRLKGGPSMAENEVAACRPCNARRGHAGPSTWLSHRREHGWAPESARVVALLRRLESGLGEGGHRKLRRYIDGQLRRL